MREIVHIQAGQCGNQIGTKVSPEGSRSRPLAAEPLSALADAPGHLLWAVSSRGAGLCQPAPPPPSRALGRAAAERCRARWGRGAQRISHLPVTIKGFGKYRNQTGLFLFFFFKLFVKVIFMFKLARPWLESEQGRQKSEQPPPSTETPQPGRVRSWAAAVCPLCLNPGACPALLAAPSRPGQGGAAGTPGIRQLRPGRAAGPPLPPPPPTMGPGRWAGPPVLHRGVPNPLLLFLP